MTEESRLNDRSVGPSIAVFVPVIFVASKEGQVDGFALQSLRQDWKSNMEDSSSSVDVLKDKKEISN